MIMPIPEILVLIVILIGVPGKLDDYDPTESIVQIIIVVILLPERF
jgi:hypothetical protein